VSKFRFKIAMSLDGYTAEPEQSTENPTLLGAGERLFEGVRDLGDLRLVRERAVIYVALAARW
jgi:hypothetical protein